MINEMNEEDRNNFEISTHAFHQEENKKECKKLAKTEDASQASLIISIEKFVNTIILSKEVIFSIGKISEDSLFSRINKHPIRNTYIDCQNKYVFDEIKRYCKIFDIDDPISSSFSIHVLNPYVELFIRHLNKLVGKIYWNPPLTHRTDEWVLETVAMLNDFIDGLRQEAQSPKFKTLRYEHQRLIIKNHRSLLNYIDKLFNRHGRLLVLRIDFGYRKDVDTPFLNQVEIYKKYWRVKKDREHFFGNMRSNTFFNDMLGYVWKLEFAALKGFHYHMLFFFDGSKVQQDITNARMIGEYWAKVITKGEGLYFNCNAKKDKYENRGIGMINHDDTVLIENLKNKVAPYLTKPDHYARVVIQENDKNRVIKGRTFGKGAIQPKSNRGRPRKNANVEQSLSTLEE